ncbi:hypothetical protein BZL29_5697 [Mycobacterium kansasii]|uniref:Uncharacterized protein n=1 Tax=Mycobacterium kansasii TaxID=1768 RepID=A0A1V3WVV8_MYCKA|nr:hypothetical protein BZL29_5697 [Mycobacterium kansasii]
MRRLLDAQWEPTVPALVQLLAATGAPRLRAAFAAAGLDGLRPRRQCCWCRWPPGVCTPRIWLSALPLAGRR